MRRPRNVARWADGGSLHATNQLAELLKSEVATDPEASRKIIVAAGMRQHADSLIDALKPFVMCQECGQRRYNPWAHRLFAQIARIVDMHRDVSVYVLQRFGAASETEIEASLSRTRAVASKTLEAACRDAVVLLQARCRAEGGYARELCAEMFGEAAADAIAPKALGPAVEPERA